MTIPEHFYRVHVKLDDHESESTHLSFDFYGFNEAIRFAEMAYMSCDSYKIWVEIVHNEVDTTESPMRRDSYNES